MKRDAQEKAGEDKKRKEEIDTRNQADNLAYSTEKQLKDLGDKIPAEHKKKIEEAKERLDNALKSNPTDIRPAMDNLNQIWSKASEEMYKSTSSQGPTPGADEQNPNAQNNGQGKKDDNVEEADYTVVDEDKQNKN